MGTESPYGAAYIVIADTIDASTLTNDFNNVVVAPIPPPYDLMYPNATVYPTPAPVGPYNNVYILAWQESASVTADEFALRWIFCGDASDVSWMGTQFPAGSTEEGMLFIVQEDWNSYDFNASRYHLLSWSPSNGLRVYGEVYGSWMETNYQSGQSRSQPIHATDGSLVVPFINTSPHGGYTESNDDRRYLYRAASAGEAGRSQIALTSDLITADANPLANNVDLVHPLVRCGDGGYLTVTFGPANVSLDPIHPGNLYPSYYVWTKYASNGTQIATGTLDESATGYYPLSAGLGGAATAGLFCYGLVSSASLLIEFQKDAFNSNSDPTSTDEMTIEFDVDTLAIVGTWSNVVSAGGSLVSAQFGIGVNGNGGPASGQRQSPWRLLNATRAVSGNAGSAGAVIVNFVNNDGTRGYFEISASTLGLTSSSGTLSYLGPDPDGVHVWFCAYRPNGISQESSYYRFDATGSVAGVPLLMFSLSNPYIAGSNGYFTEDTWDDPAYLTPAWDYRISYSLSAVPAVLNGSPYNAPVQQSTVITGMTPTVISGDTGTFTGSFTGAPIGPGAQENSISGGSGFPSQLFRFDTGGRSGVLFYWFEASSAFLWTIGGIGWGASGAVTI